MNKENQSLILPESQEPKKESLQKEILKIASEHKILIGVSIATASTIAGVFVLFECLKRRAQKDLQPELDKTAATIEEESGLIRKKQGNIAICLVASCLVQELEETEGGKKILALVKNFYQQISDILRLPPAGSSEEEIISSACAIANIIEIEGKKGGD